MKVWYLLGKGGRLEIIREACPSNVLGEEIQVDQRQRTLRRGKKTFSTISRREGGGDFRQEEKRKKGELRVGGGGGREGPFFV